MAFYFRKKNGHRAMDGPKNGLTKPNLAELSR